MKCKYFILTLCFGLSMLSCKKDPIAEAISISETTQDQVQMENEFQSLFEVADGAIKQSGLKGPDDYLPDCAQVSKDTVNKTISVFFGVKNCVCKDGLSRKGTVVIAYNGKPGTTGFSMTVTLQDYYVNDILFKGQKTISNTGDNSYNFSVSNASANFEDGTVRSWQKSGTITRIAGMSTLSPWDDIYTITGSSSGVSRKGRNYSAVSTEALRKQISFGCLGRGNFTDGIITVSDENGNSLSIDYDPIGGAPCDKIAEVKINGGAPKRITLR